MNITFLIGPGYDLDVGFEVSCKDFCKVYCEHSSVTSASASAQTGIDRFKSELKQVSCNSAINWRDLDLWLGEATKSYKDTEDSVAEFRKCLADIQCSISAFLAKKACVDSGSLPQDSAITERLTSIFHFHQNLCGLASEDKECLDKLLKQRRAEDWRANIISFSHTNVLDAHINGHHSSLSCTLDAPPPRWFGTHGKPKHFTYTVDPKVLHIYGTASPESFVVLGVDNIEQIQNIALREKLKNDLIKSEIVCALRENWHRKACDMIDSSDIICAYGMSVSSADERWWRIIIKWLLSDKQHRLIIISSSKSQAASAVRMQLRNQYTAALQVFIDKMKKEVEEVGTRKSGDMDNPINIRKHQHPNPFNRLRFWRRHHDKHSYSAMHLSSAEFDIAGIQGIFDQIYSSFLTVKNE